MILETIVITWDLQGIPHIAPMGIHTADPDAGRSLVILPFRPSRTLDNLLSAGQAVVNATDDVRIFAGCLTGRRDWPLVPSRRVSGYRLRDALATTEVELERTEEDPVRPRLHCRIVHSASHAPFRGFNRAQHAVIEAAILVSRLERLPWEKIQAELSYLQSGLDKTAGPRERQAWDWLMEKIAQFESKREIS